MSRSILWWIERKPGSFLVLLWNFFISQWKLWQRCQKLVIRCTFCTLLIRTDGNQLWSISFDWWSFESSNISLRWNWWSSKLFAYFRIYSEIRFAWPGQSCIEDFVQENLLSNLSESCWRGIYWRMDWRKNSVLTKTKKRNLEKCRKV